MTFTAQEIADFLRDADEQDRKEAQIITEVAQ